MTTQAPARERVLSIDALRGFDMFWITGGRELVLGVVALFVFPFPAWLEYQASHVEWIGFSAWDMIMPLFLFIVGAAMPFSFSKRLASGKPQGSIFLKIARRVALLWFFGMLVQGNLLQSLFSWDFSELHLFSNTLQAIACGYVIAALALMYLPLAGQAALCTALLAGYCAALELIPVPGHGAGTLEPRANVALLVDEFVLGRFRDGTTYTWILSSLGFGATVLLGVFAGHLLRSRATQLRKLYGLVAMGLAALALGALWGMFHPIIKHIWTGSMVLWSGGWCYLLLAVFYAALDIAKWRRAAFVFLVVGANAIVAYVAGELFVALADNFIGEPLEAWPAIAMLATGIASFGVLWGILYAMYRRGIFVRL